MNLINSYRFATGGGGGGGGGVGLVGSSNGATAFGTINSFTIPYPASLSATDVVVITVQTEAADTAPTISGMTQVATVEVNTADWYVFTGDGFTGNGSWTVNYTATGAAVRSGLCSVWSGASEADIVVGPTTDANSGQPGSATWASVTSVSTGVLLALILKEYDNDGLPTSLSPAHTQAGVNVRGMQHWHVDDTTVGASGTVAAAMQDWTNFGTVYLAIPEA